MNIGPYTCETAFETIGSGSARWCLASRAGQRFFVKEFLAPVRPSPLSTAPTKLRHAQQERCDLFERRKRTLYEALSCVLGDCVVPITDFLISEGRFYAVSEAVEPPYETFETLGIPSPARTRVLLYALACCLMRLHAQGIVHADLKPEHVLLQQKNGHDRVRLIDFDSGFLEGDAPSIASQIEGDPIYLAPETYLCMAGQPQPLTRRADTFAFGMIAHRLLTGTTPGFDHEHFTYLYEAVLAGSAVRLSEQLPTAYRWVIRKALSMNPDERPEDGTLQKLFSPPKPKYILSGLPVNSLNRFLLPESRRP